MLPTRPSGGPSAKALPAAAGPLLGLLGVVVFSFTLPFTRIAVRTLDPLFVGAGRAVVAGVLAAAVLAATRAPRPPLRLVPRLLLVVVGVVAGFPLLTSAALREVPAAHGAVVVGVLPAATAVAVVLRTRERPGTGFWAASAAGLAAVVAFVALSGGGLGDVGAGDALLLAAVVLAALGYAEGGLLSRELGAWQTICWALVLALPLMAAITVASASGQRPSAGWAGWLSFGYLAVFSMFLGFFAWYRGLAIGPMTRVSQVQLVQSVLTIAWCALLFGEHVDAAVVVAAAVVLVCAAAAVRARVR
ncbi:DMT family transporter [Paenibacillus sp. TRM 82003]|nr:DMT family transporter [Kineococcus sp. TRM81007]MCI2237994.1 DMT family transporter [Kineococcus sp. TRM81007]MCI3926008.1 DMT family transporter [Paenibacillus sp. TRM 82003]